MKKLFSIILAAIILVTMSTAMFAYRDTTHEAANGTPVIDGKIDDMWSVCTAYDLTIPSLADNKTTAKFRAMWDDSFIYFLVEVKDSTRYTGESPANAYNVDSVEIFLDFKNVGVTTKNTTAETYGTDSIQGQIRYNPCDGKLSGGQSMWTNFWNPDKGGKPVFKHVYTTDGYIVEAALPINTAVKKVAANDIIGCAVQVNDDANGDGTRDSYTIITEGQNNAWQHVNTLNSLKLTTKTYTPPTTTPTSPSTADPVIFFAILCPAALVTTVVLNKKRGGK